MADDDGHSRAGEFFRNRARLFRIAGIVADLQRELLAEYAAGAIEVGNRLLGAVAHLPSEGRLAAGHRSGGGNRDLVAHSP